MPQCQECGGEMVRVHRAAPERVLYASAFKCRTCGRRLRRMRQAVARPYGFVFSAHTRCVRCGNEDVRRSSRRDRAESVSTSVFSRLLGLTGAPLNACGACRTQYHDWRRPMAKATTPSDSTSPAERKVG
jgi:hypothetical protein